MKLTSIIPYCIKNNSILVYVWTCNWLTRMGFAVISSSAFCSWTIFSCYVRRIYDQALIQGHPKLLECISIYDSVWMKINIAVTICTKIAKYKNPTRHRNIIHNFFFQNYSIIFPHSLQENHAAVLLIYNLYVIMLKSTQIKT